MTVIQFPTLNEVDMFNGPEAKDVLIQAVAQLDAMSEEDVDLIKYILKDSFVLNIE